MQENEEVRRVLLAFCDVLIKPAQLGLLFKFLNFGGGVDVGLLASVPFRNRANKRGAQAGRGIVRIRRHSFVTRNNSAASCRQ